MILKIACADQKGLVHRITGVIYQHNLNVIKNDEYVDITNEKFFMRTEFDTPLDKKDLLTDIKKVLPDNAYVKLFGNKKQKIILLASKEYHCLSDIMIRCHSKDLKAEIPCIISNHTKLESLSKRFDIPFYYVDHKNKTREDHEKLIKEIIDQHDCDYIILAKYMRILTPSFINTYKNKLINIHHSFLPAFKGARPYHQAFERGVKIIGATAHFVNEDLDEGPIIEQDIIKINHGYNAKSMSKAGKDVEKFVLARALQLVLEQRVFVNGNKTIVF
ncbi:formyltetrahydrofolate deformylase [Membranihabitans maritimus]|uniref:formyltetrahydrofolate deformylase n=1 Tax=Membranihabitans maritimus TaxID=2904244 RepID=UPI001F025B1C|nr:formyltetrahydrofolate deformylase [Membranihabitans maritimus]